MQVLKQERDAPRLRNGGEDLHYVPLTLLARASYFLCTLARNLPILFKIRRGR
jgi:hypothetical protein